MANIKIKTLKCVKCQHEWIPRTAKIVLCPNPTCRTKYWEKPKERKTKRVKA